jgi:hypothetical protein
MNTTEDIQNFAEQILGETIDDDLFLLLVNVAKNVREGMRAFQYLQKLSQPAFASSIPLPSDFREPRKLIIKDVEVAPIRFDEQHLYTSGNVYFIDYSAGTYHPRTTSGDVNLYYLKETPEITASVTPLFPSRYWALLAYDVVVAIQAGIDADSEFARMAIENNRKAELIWSSMVLWDNNLQTKAQGGRTGVADSNYGGVEISMM